MNRLVIFLVLVAVFPVFGCQKKQIVVFDDHSNGDTLLEHSGFKVGNRLVIGMCPGDLLPSNARLLRKMQSSPDSIARWTEWILSENDTLRDCAESERMLKERSFASAQLYYSKWNSERESLIQQSDNLRLRNSVLEMLVALQKQKLIAVGEASVNNATLARCSEHVYEIGELAENQNDLNNLLLQKQAYEMELLKRELDALRKENDQQKEELDDYKNRLANSVKSVQNHTERNAADLDNVSFVYYHSAKIAFMTSLAWIVGIFIYKLTTDPIFHDTVMTKLFNH